MGVYKHLQSGSLCVDGARCRECKSKHFNLDGRAQDTRTGHAVRSETNANRLVYLRTTPRLSTNTAKALK